MSISNPSRSSLFTGPVWFANAALYLLVCLLALLPRWSTAQPVIDVTDHENGRQRTGQAAIWHDPGARATLDDALTALRQQRFTALDSAGSTGMKPGAFWSHFRLRNTTDRPLTLNLEYVDHQLIELTAFARSDGTPYVPIADLSMHRPFNQRPVVHNRFVVPVDLAPGETRDLLLRLSSDELGFVFPSLRIWSRDNLVAAHTTESSAIAFLFGGFFLMGLFAFCGGVATGERTFFAYAVYSLSKITCWATILGYTHQYLIRDDFQWHYMSISGAVTILCGLTFARIFLATREHTPRLDRLLQLMMANAGLLLIAALFQIKVLALATITLALLLYPVMILVGLVRWRQGSLEAAIFAVAWSLLVVGLVVQACRDLGLVEHNLFNYYWPPVASFTEMLTIMAAMGFRVRRLRQERRQYRRQLEQSKADLEAQVQARTRELEDAIQTAEREARTDALTGTRNRRSFLGDCRQAIELARRQGRPISLLMFDIDHFKTINDTHGHSLGDESLRAFTRAIVEQIRESDVFGRLGGEEFGLLISEHPDDALVTAERLRTRIGRIRVLNGKRTIRFTSSIGVAHMTPDSDIDSLLKQADQALYQAKRDGRDNVVGLDWGGEPQAVS
ncbi:sensor domain-containing diguanylate cyclase [Marinobacter bohaiensis]|uniref:sensor domain-containing diguanylate cyclase n=1 Tax=Marinobacter bohaiensis TaxID=2201898 RepID=UPI000DAC4540|nr:diguanylate cyclase [Marinobacter bohaiensis]